MISTHHSTDSLHSLLSSFHIIHTSQHHTTTWIRTWCHQWQPKVCPHTITLTKTASSTLNSCSTCTQSPIIRIVNHSECRTQVPVPRSETRRLPESKDTFRFPRSKINNLSSFQNHWKIKAGTRSDLAFWHQLLSEALLALTSCRSIRILLWSVLATIMAWLCLTSWGFKF